MFTLLQNVLEMISIKPPVSSPMTSAVYSPLTGLGAQVLQHHLAEHEAQGSTQYQTGAHWSYVRRLPSLKCPWRPCHFLGPMTSVKFNN